MTLAIALMFSSPANANVDVGQAAPDFTLPDLDGKEVALSSFKGKTVVLEWFNPECPFVVSAHEGGPLESLAGKQPEEVVWLAINSGAPGKQGHGADVNRSAATKWKLDHPILLDEKGEVGKSYGATNTPQMVVIDPKGTVAYYGALDNAPRGSVKGDKLIAYTQNAITSVMQGTEPQPDKTPPYGCSVKYK